MPVDARIALGVEPVKMPDFAQLAVQRSAVMNNMAEMASKQRALNEQNTLAQLMQDPNFSFDNPESIGKLSRAAPNLAPVVVKNYQDMQAAQTAAKAAAQKQREDQRTAGLRHVASLSSTETAVADIRAKVASGELPPDAGAAAEAKILGAKSWGEAKLSLYEQLMAEGDPSKMLEQEASQLDTGTELIDRTRRKFAMPGEGYTELGRTTKKMSLEQQAAADVARRQAAVAERNAAVNERQVAVQEGKAADANKEPFAGGYNAKVESAKNVLDVVDDLIGGPNSPPVFNDKGELKSGGGRIKAGEAGFTGAKMAAIEGSEAYNVASALETIKANLGFDRLQQMRADPDNETGGALGQVAVKELDRLEATVASAKQGQTLKTLYENLAKIRTHYNNYLKAHEEIDALKKFSRVNEGARFERVPVVDSQEEYDALPMRSPYRDSSGSLQFKGGPY